MSVVCLACSCQPHQYRRGPEIHGGCHSAFDRPAIDWKEAVLRLAFPAMHLDRDFLTTLIAILGTTISPLSAFLASRTGSRGSADAAAPAAFDRKTVAVPRSLYAHQCRYGGRHGLISGAVACVLVFVLAALWFAFPLAWRQDH
jgi:Mn2+/Fe2+ NRAMP family transporter